MSRISSSDIVVTVSTKPNKGCQPCEVQPQYIYESNVHSQNILSILNQQRKQGLLCDMTVIVEGVELQAHKAVLAACSTYFNGIITDPANVSHNIVLELSSISRLGMENLLDFAYTSKLTVSKDNIHHILAAARELDIKNLEYSCLNLLQQKLHEEANDPTVPSSNCMNSTACRNSTISRKIVQPARCESMTENQPICPKQSNDINKTQEEYTNRMLRKGDCPLLAQLSLEPKPQPQTDVTFCHVESQKQVNHVVQPEGNIPSIEGSCLMPKGQQQLNMMQLIHLQRLRMQKNEQKCSQMKMCDNYLSKSNQKNDLKADCSYLQPPCSYSSPSPSGTSFSTSTFNSDTDEALSADEDGEKMQYPLLSGANSGCSKLRKHSDVVLPFSIEQITKLPRSDLQILLNKHPNLSSQQINAMHEIRRRGKNRIAAQRCRKRKMDCILALQYELNRLRGDHNKLMSERRCVKEGALTLSEHFQKRYKEVFSDCKAKICKKFCDKSASSSLEDMKDSNDDSVMASMEQYFKHEMEQANNLADRICNVPCENLPPITISCPSMVNCTSMTSSELLVCGNEDSIMTDCNSPSACSTASYTSEGQSDSSTICPEILPECLLFTQNQTSVICSLPPKEDMVMNVQPSKEEEVMNVEVIQTSEDPS